MFWKRKKEEKPEVAKDFEARLTDIETAVSKLKRENVEISMDIDNFRDKVLRKIQTKRKDYKEEEESTTSPALDGLPRIK